MSQLNNVHRFLNEKRNNKISQPRFVCHLYDPLVDNLLTKVLLQLEDDSYLQNLQQLISFAWQGQRFFLQVLKNCMVRENYLVLHLQQKLQELTYNLQLTNIHNLQSLFQQIRQTVHVTKDSTVRMLVLCECGWMTMSVVIFLSLSETIFDGMFQSVCHQNYFFQIFLKQA